MAGLSTGADDPSLSQSYIECIQSFGEFLLALNEKDCCAVRVEQVHLPEILEEYGRFKIWGDQTKADLPARARGSLDDALRHDDELRQLVHEILRRLRVLLSEAIPIAQRKYDPAARSDHDSISSVSADSDSDSDDDSEHQRQRMPRIRLLVQLVLEQIRSLYDLSALFRRPKITDKYVRPINSKLNTTMLGSSDALPLSATFSSSDENDIVEKALQWRKLTKSGQNVEFENHVVTPVGQELTSDSVGHILWFCQRLARANARRREQLQYWSDHPCDHIQDTTNAACLTTPDLAQVPPKKENQESRSQTTTIEPLDPDLPREGPRSAVSKQSFPTANVSDIQDTKTNVDPWTVYAPLTIDQGPSRSVPEPPKMANENATFPCPYCGMTLESSEMQNRQSWKRHVFRDLRPYICTFKNCQNGEKLYASRRDWICHELQIHRREYVCKKCHKTSSNRNEMSTHLREHYGESISRNQLSVILDLCDRQVDVSGNRKDSCLICEKELPLSDLQGHLAAHMEDIALLVLPDSDKDEEIRGSKSSLQGPKPKSTGRTSDTKTETSSHGFSAVGRHGHTLVEIAKNLPSEEMGDVLQFWPWRPTDEDQKSTSNIWTREEDKRAEPGSLLGRKDMSRISPYTDTARALESSIDQSQGMLYEPSGNDLMDPIQRHSQPLTDTPPFYETDVLQSVVTGSNIATSRTIKPEIQAKIDGSMFPSDGKWTCYRRNYFSVSCSFSLHPWTNGPLFLNFPDQSAGERIRAFSMSISAIGNSQFTETRDLVQHLPKRDKQSERKPEKTILQPCEGPSSVLGHGSASNSDQHGFYLASESVEASMDKDSAYSSSQQASQPPTQHTFQCIQFQNATPDRKRKGQQKYSNLVVELHADIAVSGNEPQWVQIARRLSHPLVIRGRSPGHYKDVPRRIGVDGGSGTS